MFRLLKAVFCPPVKVERGPGVVFPPEASLLQLEGFVPAAFSYGVEILNDKETSFEFVAAVLQKYAGMTRKHALLTAANIHIKGGVILEHSSLEQAERLSGLIVQSAREAPFPLVCRAITAQQRAAGDVRDVRA